MDAAIPTGRSNTQGQCGGAPAYTYAYRATAYTYSLYAYRPTLPLCNSRVYAAAHSGSCSRYSGQNSKVGPPQPMHVHRIRIY